MLEESYTPAPGRVIFTKDDGWLIPEADRPRDWRERTQPREVAPAPAPKVQWADLPRTPAKPRRANAPGAGRPRTNHGPRILELHSEGKVTREIVAELGCSESVVNRLLREAIGDRARKLKVIPGATNHTGNLTIVAEVEQRFGQRTLLARCICGAESEIAVSRFFSGRVDSCGCVKRKKRDTSYDAEILRRRKAGEGAKKIARAIGRDPKTVKRAIADLAAQQREATA